MTATVGRHEFHGHFVPKEGRAGYGQLTFSVGIYEWVLKADGKGVKRGKVKARIYGWCSDPELVYAEARRCCAVLDAGGELGFKKRTVR